MRYNNPNYRLMSFSNKMGQDLHLNRRFKSVYLDRQLNSDSNVVCFIVQLLE